MTVYIDHIYDTTFILNHNYFLFLYLKLLISFSLYSPYIIFKSVILLTILFECARLFFSQVIVPFNHTEFIDTVTNLVEKKFIPMSRIDDAVSRILRVKFGLGLFENPLADLSLADQLGCKV